MATVAVLAGGAGASPAAAVIRGAPVPVAQYPWIVQVGDRDGTFCTGSLIRPAVVLTAAHCVADARPTEVVIGRQRTTGGDGRRVRVSRATFDEQFLIAQRGGRNSLVSDVGLLGLERAVRDVPPVPLPTAAQAPLLSAGARTVIAGWGLTDVAQEEAPVSIELHAATLPVRSSTYCLGQLRAVGGRSRGVVCAGTLRRPRATGCYGDSGGPLFAETPTGPVLVALTSSITDAGCGAGMTLFIKVLPGTARTFVERHLTPRGTLRVGRPPQVPAGTRAHPASVTPLR